MANSIRRCSCCVGAQPAAGMSPLTTCVASALCRASDTLHRFCKKEHDWGWKKFMELSKVLDGFTVADTLVIKAQVQGSWAAGI